MKPARITTQRAVRTGSWVTVPRGRARYRTRLKASHLHPYGLTRKATR